jgi:hypothetical protein
VDDWSEVRPVFRDFTGDAIHRDHSGFHAPTRYTSNLGRNDIALAQVSLSEKVIHFRVSCASPIQTEKTGDWLTLWIDLDQDGSTGFMGYEVVIHRTAATATHLSAQRFKDGAWVDLAPVPYVKLAEHLELSLPRAWLASGSEVKFDFKWADAFAGNFQSEGFYTCGDAAPERRFNYRYDSSISAEKIESWRTAHAARTR